MSDIDRIGEELRKRVLQDGVIFLEQEGKLNGILADMFPELKKERRWIRMAMESGTGKMFSRITSCTNENEKQNLYQQIKSQIEEDGLAEAAIDYVLTVFCSAIDWKWRVSEKQVVQMDLHIKKKFHMEEERLHQDHTDQMDWRVFRRCQRQVRLIVPEERWGQLQMLILCL